MKARVKKDGNMRVGQIYGNLSIMGINMGDGWLTVTSPCLTKIGTTIALRAHALHEKLNETTYLNI